MLGLYVKLNEAERTAVFKGGDAAREDASHRYRLIKYPPARNLELQVRQYAVRYEPELKNALQSSSIDEQHAIAADALGYARRSPAQISALIRACRDASDDVRDNATCALGDLLTADPELASQISPEAFLDMIASGVWTDRNKASFVLRELVRSKDRRLSTQVRSHAWEPLLEMACWRDIGHAAAARFVLGRITGIPEDRLIQFSYGPPQQFLNALDIQ